MKIEILVFLFLLLAIFLSGCLNDPTVPVDIQVVDGQGNPVEGAEVSAYSNYSLGSGVNDKLANLKGTTEATAKTGKDGKAILQLLPGQYAIVAGKSGMVNIT